jgi:hypothetical protein
MSLRFLVKVAALASTCWMSMSAAMAETRLALVIGNSNYASVSALPNPANDAKAMTKFLGDAGFQVLQAPNLTQSEMRKTIGNFASMVAEKGKDTVALVFYAGHGLQVDGENFLVPVDAQIEREGDVPLQAMRLADVMNALSAVPSKTRIVILDACRNNPFSAVNKTTGRGLAIVDAPNGSLVSYSTAPGTEALDGDGANSPYTSALVRIGTQPGVPIEQVLKRVRLEVSNATERQQFPWESSSLTDEFSFFPNGTSQSTAGNGNSKIQRPDARSVDAWQKELKGKGAREAYDLVVREDQVEAYQAYLALYPSQTGTPAVRSLLERRKVMIAWYEAVTVNTVASYQAFLAAYSNSDFAATANRLVERARVRSVGNAAAAFASAAATCPCSQPGNAPAQPQRRTDYTPAPSQGGGSPGTPGTSVAVVNPTPVTVYDPTPPIIVTTPPIIVPIRPRPPYGHDKPGRGSGNDKPTGNDQPSGGGATGGKPGKPGNNTGTTTGTNSTGSGSGIPPILRGRGNGKPKVMVNNPVNANIGNVSVRSTKMIKPMTTTITPRASFSSMTANRGMGGGGGMGGGMGRMSFGRGH